MVAAADCQRGPHLEKKRREKAILNLRLGQPRARCAGGSDYGPSAVRPQLERDAANYVLR